MNNFDFQNRTRMIFGKDQELQVGELSALYGKKVLLHYGGGSIKKFGLYDKVIASLKAQNLEVVELGGVVANPRLKLVHEGIEICRTQKIDFILAVGGGSVIDSAKGIAAGTYYDGDVWDYYTEDAVPHKALPVGVILTIPAAGSEASTASVITKEEGQLKKAFNHLCVVPMFAILNPELTYTLPNYQTSCGIVDMIGHVIERYITNTPNVELTDRLCESIMHTVVNNAQVVLDNNTDYNARAEIMWAGTLAHTNLIGMSREEDWASHMIEHEMSAINDIAHGAGLAIIYPAWMKHVYKTNPARFALFANKVFDIDINPFDLNETALKGIAALESFYRSIDMPTRFSDIDITDKSFLLMAQKATKNDTITLGAFKALSQQDVLDIYYLAK
ncbi:MAG: iron-containing alcohol dehydrogenase [Candidatus Izemoplasma sp.]